MRRPSSISRHVVATTDEIEPGERKIVTVAGRSIGVFNVGGEYFALRNRCPHQGGALCEGTLWGALRSAGPGQFEYDRSRHILTCPRHGWEFDVRTGRSWCAPEQLRVKRFTVATVTADEPELVAESYPVTREDRYLVVEIGSVAATER